MKFFVNKILIFTFIFSLLSIGCRDKREGVAEGESNISEEIIGNSPSIEIIDPLLEEVINTRAKIEILTKEVFVWSEGPVWIQEHEMVLFTDVPKNKIYKWSERDGLETYLKPSGNTGLEPEGKEGANGLLLNENGDLVLCQHGDRRMAVMDAPIDKPEAKFKMITDRFEGKKYNSPNDAVYHKNGDLYFTDPPYGLSDGQDQSPRKEITFSGVYRVFKNGEVVLIDKELTRPNGIGFSPDYSQLYVANSDSNNAIWKVYDVDIDGTVSNGRIFYDVTKLVGKEKKGLPDGLAIDNEGNLFATGPGGVLILSPEGKHLGTINTGKATANCGFNNDKSVLYMTAHDQLMRLKLK